MSNPVSDAILKHGKDRNTVFVFPSDIAAGLWMEKSLGLLDVPTLESSRFIAWDRFKEKAVQATVTGLSSVSSPVRALYAEHLARRNAESPTPFFTSLIPAAYRQSGGVFSSWIARLLPQLALWEKRKNEARSYRSDPEDADLALLKADYSAFLERHGLFEPAWQRPPLRSDGRTYLIMYPQAIEDFAEYETLLASSPLITLVPVPLPEVPPPVAVYDTVRAELSQTALAVEKLLLEGVNAADIAVSVPDLETLSPYLLREFSLRGIPVEFRSGTPLSMTRGARLFSLVGECASEGFSFAPMKALLLDRLVPWKKGLPTEELVAFGIRNHCVASWKENGKTVDVWDAAFFSPAEGELADGGRTLKALKGFYRSLRSSLLSMVSASSFTALRNAYFAFRGEFLDMDGLLDADDAVIARCVKELTDLVSLEREYEDVLPSSPWACFLSTLTRCQYVPQRTHGGVSVFPFRVAAGTPFTHHYILNAGQKSASVIYRELSFLREDKRNVVGLPDTDASIYFFSMYSAADNARFSVSARTLSGYNTPHSFFSERSPVEIANEFANEALWFSAKRPMARAYPVQLRGYRSYLGRKAPRSFSYLSSPWGDRVKAVRSVIETKRMTEGAVRVSQIDLSRFSKCPSSWFLERVLALEESVPDASLMDERNLGLLYHAVLKDLYQRVRDTDTRFTASRVDTYRQWAAEAAENAASAYLEFQGPLAAPLVSLHVKRITEGVSRILEADAEILDGWVPDFLEDSVSFIADGVSYFGRIDRISRRESDNMLVLIDYKSGKTPAPKDYDTKDGNYEISDFQIPMYLHLAEKSPGSPYFGSTITEAWFASISAGEFVPIVNDGEEIKCGNKRNAVRRESFEPAMESFASVTADFVSAVRSADFRKRPHVTRSVCAACEYCRICRTTYMVRQ